MPFTRSRQNKPPSCVARRCLPILRVHVILTRKQTTVNSKAFELSKVSRATVELHVSSSQPKRHSTIVRRTVTQQFQRLRQHPTTVTTAFLLFRAQRCFRKLRMETGCFLEDIGVIPWQPIKQFNLQRYPASRMIDMQFALQQASSLMFSARVCRATYQINRVEFKFSFKEHWLILQNLRNYILDFIYFLFIST